MAVQQKEDRGTVGGRLFFLDWLRMLMVVSVSYAHTVFCGIDRMHDITEDNHAYAAALQEHQNSFRPRWVSYVRPIAIPVLFWISGASLALGFRSDVCGLLKKSMLKLSVLSVIGISLNAVMWNLSPRNQDCSINHLEWPQCKGKGVLFDFTEDPNSGSVEPYFNQMWYTVALLLLMPLSIPYFRAVAGFGGHHWLVLQFALTAAVYIALALLAEEVSQPGPVLACLLVSEAVFLALGALAASTELLTRLRLPLRVVHYVAALVGCVQFGTTPIGDIKDMTLGYFLYFAVGVLRWFQLGFLMTRPRKGVDSKPCLSKYWPLVMVLLAFVIPSTNWYFAAMLPYPYFPGMLDRSLYAAGTFTWIFIIDRCSRTMPCEPLPRVLHLFSLVLYLGQVALLQSFMATMWRSVEGIWALVTGSALLLAWLLAYASSPRRPPCDAEQALTA